MDGRSLGVWIKRTPDLGFTNTNPGMTGTWITGINHCIQQDWNELAKGGKNGGRQPGRMTRTGPQKSPRFGGLEG